MLVLRIEACLSQSMSAGHHFVENGALPLVKLVKAPHGAFVTRLQFRTVVCEQKHVIDDFVCLRASTSRCGGSHVSTQHEDVCLRGDGHAAQHAERRAPSLWAPAVGRRDSATITRLALSLALDQGPSSSKWRIDWAVSQYGITVRGWKRDGTACFISIWF